MSIIWDWVAIHILDNFPFLRRYGESMSRPLVADGLYQTPSCNISYNSRDYSFFQEVSYIKSFVETVEVSPLWRLPAEWDLMWGRVDVSGARAVQYQTLGVNRFPSSHLLSPHFTPAPAVAASFVQTYSDSALLHLHHVLLPWDFLSAVLWDGCGDPLRHAQPKRARELKPNGASLF